MIEQILEKQDKPERQERPDRRNSLEIFEGLYRIGREAWIIKQLQKYSLPQPIPQKMRNERG